MNMAEAMGASSDEEPINPFRLVAEIAKSR